VEITELLDADEAFLTNSIIEIMPLTCIDDTSIGTGKPGVLTQKLMSAYRELIEKELADALIRNKRIQQKLNCYFFLVVPF